MPDGIDPHLLTAIAQIVRQEIEPLHEGQVAMRGDIASIRGDITTIRGDITTMRGDITSIQGDVATLQSDMVDVKDNQHQMASDITRFRTDIMDRIDRLQDSVTTDVTQLRDETVVNYGATERVERMALAAQAETRALAVMVTPMVRQTRRLQDDVRDLRGDV